ncbi:MAG: SDR family oxidoreductase [Pirellulales bacterium]|nr:SDR family oxidoreductase [Pirellulales bacterium]
MKTYLVTGGAGFIGSHLVDALVRRGDHVRVLDNLCTGQRALAAAFPAGVEFIEGDLIDPRAVSRAVEGVEVVFHQAALASVPRSVDAPLDTNAACVTGTVTLLDAARRGGVRRVVFAGSSSIYGDQPTPAKHEGLLPMPLSPYAAAKVAGEMYCQAFTSTYGLQTVTIRYFNVFGPRQDPKSQYAAVIPKFITEMLAGRRPTIFGDGCQSRDFTYIENIVHGNLLAAEAPDAVGRTINVACGESFDLNQLVAGINRALGTSLEPVFEPARTGDVRESLADISLARQLLQYEPIVGFEEGLKKTVDFYRNAGVKQ